MANRIVRDGNQNIHVKEARVAAAGTEGSAVPKVNAFVADGVIRGLVGQTPVIGEDGAFYATVDTVAEVRLGDVSGAFGRGATVYRKTSDGVIGSAAGTGIVAIGYTTREKTNTAAGDLWVQLIPTAI